MTRPSAATRRKAWVALGAAVTMGAVTLGGAFVALEAGCTQQPILEPLRSLERSGTASYICLAVPGDVKGIARPLGDCKGFAAPDPFTFNEDDAGTIVGPHLYAMVTQTSRGEVAVVDLTAGINSVIDEDPGIPGANFLPVGAQPIDIVSTPGSTATFVGVGEVGREGIFAIPSILARPSSLLEDGGVTPAGDPPRPPPELSSWPACALPAAPGAMLLIDDPPNAQGDERARCDDPYGRLPPAGAQGDLGLEGNGRPKIVVAIPDKGGIAVIDAQTLLDLEPGSFGPCPVDRWLPLDVRLPKTQKPPKRPPGLACVWPLEQGPDYEASYTARPAGMSYADGRLYIADLQAPVVHVIQMPSPCAPVEIAPLLPTSKTDDETRVPVTKKVSVGPMTSQLKRYAYAIDEKDSSMMVFDVSPTSANAYPIQRPHPEWDPLTARDRVRLGSPVADVILAQHDAAQFLPRTGVAPEGALCDPNPDKSCPFDGTECDVGAIYRTSTAFDTGAGPMKLRGIFAFAALTNGRIGVVDVEDYDAPCRVPGGLLSAAQSPLAGCPPSEPFPSKLKHPASDLLLSANEASCGVVIPNTPRDSVYTAPDQNAGFHEPSLQTLPLLFDKNGSVIDTANPPFMVGTAPADPTQLPVAALALAGTPVPVCTGVNQSCIDPATWQARDESGGLENTVFMNLEDPRAQVADQEWTVTFEGALPAFAGKLAIFQFDGKPSDGLYDSNSRFCDSGVQSQKAVQEMLDAYQAHDAAIQSETLADYVQIITDLPLETDPFWNGVDPKVCSYSICNSTFGTFDTPTPFRDMPITEAYQDHVELKLETHELLPQGQYTSGPKKGHDKPPAREPIDPDVVNCCFPPPVAFNVRAGGQWLVLGATTGVLHHVIPDPDTGVCRNSCDPLLERLNSRVVPIPRTDTAFGKYVPVPDQTFSFDKGASIFAFMNPMFRFAIVGGDQRDENFTFTTQGSFQPLLVTLAPDATTLMAPVAISIVPPFGELLAVIDGGHQGITTVQIGSATVSRHFY